MIEYVKPLIAWLNLHPHWGGLIVFLISLGESVAIFGLLVPGSVIMTAVGAIIGAGVLPLYSTMLWAILGAIAGDGLSYRIGYHYNDRIRQSWLFQKKTHWVERGENFFKQHGGKSVFIGRFMGPVRPIVPLVAGMMRFDNTRFLVSNISSAILWAPAYMMPGILLGVASTELPPEIATRVILAVLAGILILLFAGWFIQHCLTWFFCRIDKTFVFAWQKLNAARLTRRFCDLIRDPRQPDYHGQLSLCLLGALFLVCFLLLAVAIDNYGSQYFSVNNSVYHWMRILHTSTGQSIFIWISYLGDKMILLPVIAIVLAWLFLKKKYRAAIHYGALIVMGVLSIHFCKHLITETRPIGLNIPIDSYSFPSGHCTLSIIVFGFFAILISQKWPRTKRWTLYKWTTGLILLVCFSRLYLGAHWFTDTLGGVLLGLGLLQFTALSHRHSSSDSIKPWPFSLIFLTSLLTIGTIYASVHFDEASNVYMPKWPDQILSQSEWWDKPSETLRFRHNHGGRAIEPINVEWAGELPEIENTLHPHDWHTQSPMTLKKLFSHLSPTLRTSPLLPRFYQDRKPVLTMTHALSSNPPVVIVLRLWDSDVLLDGSLPLWVGTVAYYDPNHHDVLNRYQHADFDKLKPATFYLSQGIQGLKWKRVDYAVNNASKHGPAVGERAGVLYIKPKG